MTKNVEESAEKKIQARADWREGPRRSALCLSPAAAAAGETRLNLRGFPAPILRNGFTQLGILETLNINEIIVIQGPLVPVLGRAAPGGIQNFLTTRPSAKERNKFEAGTSTENRQRASWESTGA